MAQDILRSLVRERQDLRAAHSSDTALEANRLAIVFWQQRLSRELVAEHRLPKAS